MVSSLGHLIFFVFAWDEPVEMRNPTGVRVLDELTDVKEVLVTRVAAEKVEQILVRLTIYQALQFLSGSSQTETIFEDLKISQNDTSGSSSIISSYVWLLSKTPKRMKIWNIWILQ